jgi:uncharacterized membrane protein YbhN (UPF0104 family)
MKGFEIHLFTNLFIIVIIFFIAVYDIFAYFIGGIDNTISAAITRFSRANLWAPFIAGALAWHLWGCG